jgi:hypothetical protein
MSPVKQSPQKIINLGDTGMGTEILSEAEMKKKLKDTDKKMIKMRNENQALKLELEKANRVLEKEVGEVIDLD